MMEKIHFWQVEKFWFIDNLIVFKGITNWTKFLFVLINYPKSNKKDSIKINILFEKVNFLKQLNKIQLK